MSCIDLPDKMLKYLLYLLYLQLPHVNYENILMSAYSESATKCSNDPAFTETEKFTKTEKFTETEKYHNRLTVLELQEIGIQKTVYYR